MSDPNTRLMVVWGILLLGGLGFAYLLHWLGKHYGKDEQDDQFPK